MRKIISQLLLLVGFTLVFNACGSEDSANGFTPGSTTNNTGGENPKDDPTDNTVDPVKETKGLTDVLFVDTFCTGLPYTTFSVTNDVTGTGSTSLNGSASVPDGTEYIQFEIGGIVLGKVNINQVITITDLFKNSNLDDNRVIFASRLLLSIDTDGDSDNGIQISTDVSDRIGNFTGVDGKNITNLNVDDETATEILTALLNYLGIGLDNLVSKDDARTHLGYSMETLEEGVSTVILERDNVNCLDGGIAKVHRVDFDKTDSDDTLSAYTTYFCNSLNEPGETTDLQKDTTHFQLSQDNAYCPDNGGIRTNTKVYTIDSNSDKVLVSDEDKYTCDGSEAYTLSTSVLYGITESNSECKDVISRLTQVKKQDDTSVNSNNIDICKDSSENIVELVTLVEDSTCLSGGVRADYFADDLKTELVSSSYFCNQSTDRAQINGEHNVVIVTPDSITCPNGGIEYQHSVDEDNNGDLETKYSEIQCNLYEKTSSEETIVSSGETTIRTTKVLLTSDMSDFSQCPFGGYRLEKKMVQGNNILSKYNDYICTDLSTELIRDDVTPETLKGSEYNSANNTWCPNGGIKYNHAVYFNDILNHSYYEISCSPGSQVETNTTTILEINNEICPDGGKIITVNVEFNGDSGNPANYTYDVTICEGINYNSDTYEVEDVKNLLIGDLICPFGGKIITHKRYVNDTNEHIERWDYDSTHCDGFEYDEAIEDVQIIKTYILNDGNTVCPDGGVVKNHKRYVVNTDGSKIYLPFIDFDTTHCSGLEYDDTYDVPVAQDVDLTTICPYGGRVTLHKRLTKDGDIHVARWDYKTTICNSIDYDKTRDEQTEVILEMGNPICPDGGKIVNHARYADTDGNGQQDNHIADWDYSETICSGLEYSETVENQVVTDLEMGDETCPDGGKFVEHQIYLDDNNDNIFTENIDTVRISKWDYSTTHCEGLDYNKDTVNCGTEIKLLFGSEICPDGGSVIEHKRWTTTDGTCDTKVDHVAKWDYSSTHCVGLEYSETEECGTENTLDFGSEICPDGGVLFEHKRCLIGTDTHIEKFDYQTTTCIGLEYSQTKECGSETTWAFGESEICPDGGSLFEHKRCTIDGDIHKPEWDYQTTTCIGLEYSDTLEFQITSNAPISDCPDGGSVIEHIRYIDTNTNGTYDEDIDQHVSKWDFSSTVCTGLEYDDTVEFTTTSNAPVSDCPYGGEVVLHERWIVDADGEKVTHIKQWDYPTTHCTDDVKYVDNTTEFILPIGDPVCPDGGKIVQHSTTLNGVLTSEYKTTHCGYEGVSIDTSSGSDVTIAGYLIDINGLRIEGATVSISVDDVLYEVITGVNGVYQIYNAVLGSEVTVTANGYKTIRSTATTNILNFTLISIELNYVSDLELIFFNIDREMGADKALEYAEIKGWRLLTFDELTALYHSDRKIEFTGHEYFSSTVQTTSINDDGYNLWTLDFSNGQKFPHWSSHVKHLVFTNNVESEGTLAKEFTETKSNTDWNSANSVCSKNDQRLPTVEEMKVIYFNSEHPIGIADQKVTGGEYWTLNQISAVNALFFRVIGPVEDYKFEEADKKNPKKVICITPDGTETIEVNGTVTDSENNPLNNIEITLRVMDDLENTESTYTVTTDANGFYEIDISGNRYLVSFDTTTYNETSDINYISKNITLDLRVNKIINISLVVKTEEVDNNTNAGNSNDIPVCDTPECTVVSFNIGSNFDTDSNKWTYTVTKDANGNVDKTYFTLKLSSLCMQQITGLNGGSAVPQNSLGVIDSIQSDGNGEISFIVNSSAEYDVDVNSPLTILTDTEVELSANIAIPVCFYLDEKHSVVGNVQDENRNVIAGATVEAIVTDIVTGEGSPYTFKTDSTGAFSSEVELKLKNETANGSFFASKEGYTNSNPEIITLARDVINTVNTLVLTAKDMSITGILTSNGVILSGVTVVIKDENEDILATKTTDNDGAYSYETKVGTKVSIEVSKENYSSKNITLTTVSTSVNEFNFQLEKETVKVNFSLTVLDILDDSAISGAKFVIKDSDGIVRYEGTVDAYGDFYVEISKTVGVDLVGTIEISATGYEVKTSDITVTDEDSSKEIKLSGLPAKIIVNVKDSDSRKYLENVSVSVYKKDQDTPIITSTTDVEGNATFENLASGDYRVLVTFANYSESSQDVTLSNSETLTIYESIAPRETNSGSHTIMQGMANNWVAQYQNNSERSSKFEARVNYSSEDEIWNYTILKVDDINNGPELSHWYLDLDDICLANLENVTSDAELGIDGSLKKDPQGILGTQTNVLKWNTDKGVGTSGITYSFKIKSDVTVQLGSNIKVPLVFKAATVGGNSEEGYSLVNIPAPICSGGIAEPFVDNSTDESTDASKTLSGLFTDSGFAKCVADKMNKDITYEPTAEELGKIKDIHCHEYGITDTSSVTNLVNVEKLCFKQNSITTLTNIDKLTKLKKLDLSQGNPVTDFSNVSSTVEITIDYIDDKGKTKTKTVNGGLVYY